MAPVNPACQSQKPEIGISVSQSQPGLLDETLSRKRMWTDKFLRPWGEVLQVPSHQEVLRDLHSFSLATSGGVTPARGDPRLLASEGTRTCV